jgi:hypothetical protein
LLIECKWAPRRAGNYVENGESRGMLDLSTFILDFFAFFAAFFAAFFSIFNSFLVLFVIWRDPPMVAPGIVDGALHQSRGARRLSLLLPKGHQPPQPRKILLIKPLLQRVHLGRNNGFGVGAKFAAIKAGRCTLPC